MGFLRGPVYVPVRWIAVTIVHAPRAPWSGQKTLSSSSMRRPSPPRPESACSPRRTYLLSPREQRSPCSDDAPATHAMEQATAWAKLRAARGVLARAQVDWNMRSLRLAADALAGAEQEHTALLLEREGRLGEKLEAEQAERAGLQAALADAGGHLQTASSALRSHQTMLEEARAELEAGRAAVDNAEAERARFVEELKLVSLELAQARSEIEESLHLEAENERLRARVRLAEARSMPEADPSPSPSPSPSPTPSPALALP